MSGQHTQGRLWAMPEPATPGKPTALVGADSWPEMAWAQSHADARRLAACWNACEGVATEAIEQVMVNTGPLLANKLAECDQLRAELSRLMDQTEGRIAAMASARCQLAAARALLKAENLSAADRAAMKRFPIAAIAQRAQQMVDDAVAADVVLTITQVPRLPLAMGNYETVVAVRPARGRY